MALPIIVACWVTANFFNGPHTYELKWRRCLRPVACDNSVETFHP